MQPNDGQLLEKFLQNCDEHAFEELVKRHAGMVMAVCRRVLGDAHDAEEAFQNTFLVLVRKAGMHLQADSIGGWLYNVATRTALDIRGRRLTQASRFVEQEGIDMIPQTEESISTVWEAMKGLLDEELVQLADKYRQPLILCYLEGKNTEQAAQDLGLSYSTLKVRLMRGRELLRKRLVRRGVVVSANLLGTVLIEQVAQSAEVVSEVLIQSTVKAATALLSTAAGVTAITAASKLTILKGMVIAMMYKKAMLVIGGLVLLGLLGSIAYWSQGKQKSLPARELPAIVAHKQVAKPSAGVTTQTGTTETSQTATTEQISDSAEKITLPESIDDFLKRFAQGLKAAGAEKWKTWRQLGIDLTDEEFEAAWAEALKSDRFKGGTTADPRCAMLGLTPAEMAMFLNIQDAIFKKWVDKNPFAAVEWCKILLAFPSKKGMERAVFYMSYDQEGLMPERESFRSGSQYNLLSALIACWGKKDLNAATKWAQAQSTGLGRDAAMVGVALALSRENPAEAIKLIEKENIRFDYQTYSVLQNNHLYYIFSNWVLQNRSEAIAYLTSLPRDVGPDDIHRGQYNSGMRALGYQWAKADLSGALQWTETLSDVEKNNVLGTIIEEWAKKDFAGAGNYVTSLWERQDSENNYQMLWSLANVWLEKDPQACVEWALHLTDKWDPKKRIKGHAYGNKQNILGFSCKKWAIKDYKAAFQWAEKIPSDPLRKVALESVMGGLVFGAFADNEFTSIQECVTLLDEANIPEAYRRGVYQNMVSIWVQKNSPKEAMEWIRTLSNGNDKDVLISMCCTSDTASFPEQMQWASEMQGEKYRTDLTKMMLLRWCKSNVAEAKSWAQNSPLSATADKWIQESSLSQSVKDKWLAGK